VALDRVHGAVVLAEALRAPRLPELRRRASSTRRAFPAIFELLQRRFREKPRDAWFAELRAKEICATPVYDMAEALDDEHNRSREMIVSLEHPAFGR